MGKKLVIVESPAKAKTINKILGSDYIVTSSLGHIRDLPVKSIGVDVHNAFKPKYVTAKGKKKVVSQLKGQAKKCESVYLAPDPDREGEAIAWHIESVLKPENPDKEFWRVEYNEITPQAVRRAFETPGHINRDRVDAQQARRVLDRLVGYTVSPMLWRRIRRGLSAGRVQSVALRLVCERETQIRDFVAEKFWIIGATVRKLVVPLNPFDIKLMQINDEKAEVKSAEHAEQVKSDLEGRELKVIDINTRTVSKRPPPPFITSGLQQAGSGRYGFSPRRTMSIAQKLYEGVDMGDGPVGLITYMRTDSFRVAKEAVVACRDLVKKKFGEQYCPETPNTFRSRKSAQEAHEAIRPTDVGRTPESMAGRLEAPELKLYSLIWTRFVASQMCPAKIEQRTVKIEAMPKAGEANRYMFHVSASNVKFDGYMKAAGMADAKKEDEDEVAELPNLAKGEPLVCLEWLSEEKETKPPARYSEASLVKALEANGVGRPSTYAQTVSTLQQREYVVRERRSLVPTDLGMQVSEMLVESLGELFDITFTASMEERLDEVENGRMNWTRMLEEFHVKFEEWMSAIRAPVADTAVTDRILSLLARVEKWAPETKRGKRVYSDSKFVESIRRQLEGGSKAVTQRQLEALVKIACRYRDQVVEIETVLKETGFATVLTAPAHQPPKDVTVKKLQLLESIGMDESAEKFIGSLRSRVDGGRSLTEAQVKALDNVVLAHRKKIDDLETLKDQLELPAVVPHDDRESKTMLEALLSVKTWKDPVTRGKRVFDDEKFYESLSQHYEAKGFLSVRQKAALGKMVARYRESIPDFERIARECGISSRKRNTGRKQPDDSNTVARSHVDRSPEH